MNCFIFGAGKIGAEAMKYYGSESVTAFCDNNQERQGQLFCGKKILSVSDMIRLRENEEIIIASNYFVEMSEQLRKYGINNYEIYLPELTKFYDRIKDGDIRDHRIAICGIDEKSVQLVSWLRGRSGNNTIVLTDKSQSIIGKKVDDDIVRNFEEVKNDVDVVIVGAEKRSYAIQAYLQRMNSGYYIINPFIRSGYYPKDVLLVDEFNVKDILSEEEWNEKTNRIVHFQKLDEYVEELYEHLPLFEHVEVETINRCNGKCSFCPVSAGNDIRTKEMMNETLFRKIVDELHDLNYEGRFATFSNNEPFLDPRVVEFNRYARQQLPKARIHLFTNGSVLTKEVFLEIVPYLDELIIDNYTTDGSLNKNTKIIYDYCQNDDKLKEKVTIVIRNENAILTSRGGDSPNRDDIKSYPDEKCALPFKQMIIRPSGKVSLCCNDPYGKFTLGDANLESLKQIWYGPAFSNIRKKLMEGRKTLDKCKYCDTFIYY